MGFIAPSVYSFGMMPSPEVGRAKARIRALAAKTAQNGCTDAEAFAAAEMIDQLLDRYTLTMDEMQVRASPCAEGGRPGRQTTGPLDTCVPALAGFCQCIVWLEDSGDAHTSGGQSAKRYVYFGSQAAVEMALYRHSVTARVVIGETADFPSRQLQWKGDRMWHALPSFQHGLVVRLGKRLDVLHQAREWSLRARTGRRATLVLAKQTMVAAAFAGTKIRLWSRRSSVTIPDRRTFMTGQHAGEGVNLRRPVGDISSLVLQRRALHGTISDAASLPGSKRRWYSMVPPPSRAVKRKVWQCRSGGSG